MRNTHDDDSGEISRLVRLNKLEVVIAVVVGLMTVANCVGAWYVLPYRVASAESAVTDLRSEKEKELVDIRARLKEMEARTELLIRIDERLSRLTDQVSGVRIQLDRLEQQRRGGQ